MPSAPNSCSVMRAIGGGPYTLQVGNSIGALIPALEHEPAVVHAVVVVQVGEERVRGVDRAMPALDQALMRAWPVVPDDEIVADLDEIAGALTDQRRRRRAGAEQRNREWLGEVAGEPEDAPGRMSSSGTAGDAASAAMKSLRFNGNTSEADYTARMCA